MSNDYSYGSYIRFSTVSNAEGVVLVGADNLIGDVYTVEVAREESGDYRAWLINRFGKKVGFIDDDRDVMHLQTLAVRGWTIRALLSLVFHDTTTEPVTYSGEVALICNDPHYDEAFDTFAKTIGQKLGEEIRPDINLSPEGVRQVVKSGGTWCPDGRVKKPSLREGEQVIKERRSSSDKLVEAGRQKKVGCLIGTVIFWVAVAAGVVFAVLKWLGVI